MITALEIYHRALRLDYTRATFRTLTRHAASGHFDEWQARRLLARNVRDTRIKADVATRRAAVELLFNHWRNLARPNA